MCADLCKKAEMVSLSDSDVILHPTALYEECSYSDEEASLTNEEKEYCFACGCDSALSYMKENLLCFVKGNTNNGPMPAVSTSMMTHTKL